MKTELEKQNFIDDCYNERCDQEHDRLREQFEDMTLDSCDHRNKITIAECYDWRDEFCRDEFCDFHFWRRSFDMTDDDMYNILKKIYNM